MVNFTKNKDPSRLINAASGANHRICGNILAMTHYPNPEQILKTKDLINVIAAYGGYGIKTEEYSGEYDLVENEEQLNQKYIEFIDNLIGLTKTGISGATYTKYSDVESELNGLIKYDREEMKINEEQIKQANEKVIRSLN